ncbi:hypothetical protein VKT23_014689 [Stygiomarasmius scandens]|uniref:DUF5648 domain-containing protein n=1 Tax=Marasmiellus scandens TaxID=2682957 RepID=A0ABR1IZF0_9AGAR
MKFSTLILPAASLFYSTLVHSSPLEVRTAQTCGNPSDTVPFLRAVSPSNGDHFYTTNPTEMVKAITNLGYKLEGNAAQVFTTQELSTVPFFRLVQPRVGDHFYTTSASERDNAILSLGYVDEGVAAFIYTDGNCGGQPIFRLVSLRSGDHFYTMNAAERDSAVGLGYTLEGIAGFTLPPA